MKDNPIQAGSQKAEAAGEKVAVVAAAPAEAPVLGQSQ